MKTPEVGEYWQENSSRATRFVQILGFAYDSERGRKTRVYVQIRNVATKRSTWANFDRFNGKSGGYSYLYGRCHDCQVARGGRVPKGGFKGITIALGTCGGCLKQHVGLIPTCDYNWPGKPAVWD